MSEVAEIVEADQVVAYLRDNPRFFEAQSVLLEELQLDHAVKGAVSLVERQVQQLRQRNSALKEQLQQLIGVAGENERLSTRLFDLALDLARETELTNQLALLKTALAEDFAGDRVHLELLDGQLAETFPESIAANGELNQFGDALEIGVPICGTDIAAEIALAVAPDGQAMASWAVIPVGRRNDGGTGRSDGTEKPIGALLIGSSEPNRFTPDLGTEFLQRLGEIVDAVLAPHLGPVNTNANAATGAIFPRDKAPGT